MIREGSLVKLKPYDAIENHRGICRESWDIAYDFGYTRVSSYSGGYATLELPDMLRFFAWEYNNFDDVIDDVIFQVGDRIELFGGAKGIITEANTSNIGSFQWTVTHQVDDFYILGDTQSGRLNFFKGKYKQLGPLITNEFNGNTIVVNEGRNTDVDLRQYDIH